VIKKTITFKDLDDNDVTEDFYFSLSTAELAEMELEKDGGFAEYLRAIISSENRAEILKTFKMIMLLSVGKRAEDGRRFLKSTEITNEFIQSDAYSVLFMELIQDATMLATFIRGIVPASMSAKMPDLNMVSVEGGPAARTNVDDYSEKELLEMPSSKFQALVGTDPTKMSKSHLVLAMRRRTSGKEE
jgi:hypothetical protein